MKNQLLEFIKKSKKIAILSHRNPDGDAFGSALALYEFLDTYFKEKEKVVFLDMQTINEEFKTIIKGVNINTDDADFDSAICVDISDKKLLGVYEEMFDNIPNTLCIDHHKSNNNFCDINIINCLSSNCEHLYNILKETDLKITEKIAKYLCIGIMTDTNNLTINSVNSNTYRTVAEIEDLGVDVYGIRKIFFSGNSIEKYKIIAIAMSKVEFLLNNKVMFINLTKEEFESCGLDENDTIGIINQAFYMKDAVACFLVTPRKGKNHVSMRSINGIDVSLIAEYFGGGGHKCASACDTTFELYDIKNNILDMMQQQINNFKPQKDIF